MTAMNLVVQTQSAHLLTDRALYNVHGRLTRFTSKVLVMPELRTAIATGGSMTAERLSGLLDLFARPDSLPVLFAQLGRVLPMAKAERARAARSERDMPAPPPGQDWADFFLGVACWVPEEDCAAGYLITSSQTLGVTPYEPFRLDSYFNPGVDLSAALGRTYDWRNDAERFQTEEDGVALLEAQRRSTDAVGWHAVGGAVELTTVTRAGIGQRLLSEWPEDRVGEFIAAAA